MEPVSPFVYSGSSLIVSSWGVLLPIVALNALKSRKTLGNECVLSSDYGERPCADCSAAREIARYCKWGRLFPYFASHTYIGIFNFIFLHPLNVDNVYVTVTTVLAKFALKTSYEWLLINRRVRLFLTHGCLHSSLIALRSAFFCLLSLQQNRYWF